jgi:hypothetical protein
VSVAADVYAPSEETSAGSEVVSSVTASGGVVVSTANSRRNVGVKFEAVESLDPSDPAAAPTTTVTSIVASNPPTLVTTAVLMPQKKTAGVNATGGGSNVTGITLTGDGVVSFESVALPGVTIKVDGSAAGLNGGVTVLSGNGTISRIHTNFTVVSSSGGGGSAGPSDTGSAAVSILARGSLEASVGDDKAEVYLSSSSPEEAAAAVSDALGIEATYDAATGLITLTLPDGATVTADASAFISGGGVATGTGAAGGIDGADADAAVAAVSDTTGPIPVIFSDPDDPMRPLPGYGVVVHNGEVVPSLALNDEVGDGPCDAVRKLKNFLTTSLEPGMETYVVMGAVSHCEGRLLEVRGDE